MSRKRPASITIPPDVYVTSEEIFTAEYLVQKLAVDVCLFLQAAGSISVRPI